MTEQPSDRLRHPYARTTYAETEAVYRESMSEIPASNPGLDEPPEDDEGLDP